MKTTERLYLKPWEYNACRILTELDKIINNEGGRTNESYTELLISERSEKSNNTEPIRVLHRGYILFVLNGDYYAYHINENPFCDFTFCKYPIEDGNKYNANRYAINDKKEWIYDCFLKANCSDADIKEAANMIFNMLIKSGYGQQVVKKQRVYCEYCNQYYYETKPEKCIRKIDF